MATKVLTDPQHYTDIANAIREKNGTNNTYIPADMANAILAIESGGGGTSVASPFFGRAVGVLPSVYKGNARSTGLDFTGLFETGAVGTVYEPVASGLWYYNGVLLPEIPAGVLAEYPYVFIGLIQSTGKYQILASTQPMYFADVYIRRQNNNSEPFLYCVEGDETWSSGTSGNYGWNVDSDRIIIWSNHDIPNGSATATDIYFYASDPVPAE